MQRAPPAVVGRHAALLSLLILVWAGLCTGAFAQGIPGNKKPGTDVPTAPSQVEVRRNVDDDEIR